MTEKTSEEPDFDKLLERLLEENRKVKGTATANVKHRRRRPVGRLIVVAVSLSLMKFEVIEK